MLWAAKGVSDPVMQETSRASCTLLSAHRLQTPHDAAQDRSSHSDSLLRWRVRGTRKPFRQERTRTGVVQFPVITPSSAQCWTAKYRELGETHVLAYDEETDAVWTLAVYLGI
jgi:hypothetical protein